MTGTGTARTATTPLYRTARQYTPTLSKVSGVSDGTAGGVSPVRWPTITWLAGELRLWNENTEFASTVYLNVWLSSDEYVIDSVQRRDAECVSRGYIPGYKHRFNARELARQLIDDAKASCGQGGRTKSPSGRPYFTQAGTDDYGPSDQLFPQPMPRTLQGVERGPSTLQGLAGDYLPFYPIRSRRQPTPSTEHACPRCGAALLYPTDNCTRCADTDNVFVRAVPRTWKDEDGPPRWQEKTPRKKKRR